MIATEWPCSSRMCASVEPTRPHPMMTMCTAASSEYGARPVFPRIRPATRVIVSRRIVVPGVSHRRQASEQREDPFSRPRVSPRPGRDGLLELAVGAVAHGGFCVRGTRTAGRCSSGTPCRASGCAPGSPVPPPASGGPTRSRSCQASPDRVEPPCPHARPGGCGGCDWQHATPEAQRGLKAEVVRQQLRRIAGLDHEVTVEPLPGGAAGWAGGPGSGSRWAQAVPPGCSSTATTR